MVRVRVCVFWGLVLGQLWFSYLQAGFLCFALWLGDVSGLGFELGSVRGRTQL